MSYLFTKQPLISVFYHSFFQIVVKTFTNYWHSILQLELRKILNDELILPKVAVNLIFT